MKTKDVKKKEKQKNNIVKYKPMICPICGEFYFPKLRKDDIDFGYDGTESICYVCGWEYNLEDLKNPSLIKEKKEEFKKKRSEDPEYNYLDATRPPAKPHLCPVCGKYMFEDEGSYDICPYCHWEDDDLQEDDPDYAGGANDLSLNQFKELYLRSQKSK